MKRQSDKQTFNMNFGAKKWAALYVRLSRDDDSEGDSNSIAHQIEILKKYAKDHNIIQYKIYKDDGYSGTNFNRARLSGDDFRHRKRPCEYGYCQGYVPFRTQLS